MFTSLAGQNIETFTHIAKTLLPEYIRNSFTIALFTGLFTMVIGVSAAWILTMYEFKFSKFFNIVLILPLAIPTYIAGYVYSGIFSYTGIISRTARNLFGYNLNLDIMNIYGVIFIFTFFLYPYVFIIARSFFAKQSLSMLEAAKVLGKSDTETFFLVVLPLARTAVIGGVTLVIMEVLSAFGLPSYFGVQTFSTGIFRTWLALGDTDSAITLAIILMTLIFTIILIEKKSRGRRQYSFTNTKIRPINKKPLSAKHSVIAVVVCMIPILFGVIIPLLQLISWSFMTYGDVLNYKLIKIIKNTFSIGIAGAILATMMAVIISNTSRLKKGKISKTLSKLTTIGYSIPGAVIAIGVMTFFIFVDKKILGQKVFYGTLFLMVFAYVIRYLAVAYNSVESGFDKVGIKFHEASRSLGYGKTKTFFAVDLPMIKGSIIGAVILTFLEIIKELPLTLILRPFNFETLSTYAKRYADDEMVQHSAIPSIILILIGISIIIFFETIKKKKEKKK
ncbi:MULTISPECIES: ABC transporter permease [Psychrilyobacter]|uniref:ABC transporter permease n=1 Tax=Psychrilyobacter TaxID=623282 RepID=UPI0013140E46|nr:MULTISPECIES: iron ABC transporter permease [Psychrilyobacter]NDI78207.1 iron ABC transporter permease [Psychrilyobacter piezotolerans]